MSSDLGMVVNFFTTRSHPAGESTHIEKQMTKESLKPTGSIVGHLTLGEHSIVDGISNSVIVLTEHFYEDGWLGKSGTLEFMTSAATWLELKGEFPVWSKLETLTLRCKSESEHTVELKVKPGEFQIRLPLPKHRSRHRIHFECSSVFPLPAPDDRKIVLLFNSFRLLGENSE